MGDLTQDYYHFAKKWRQISGFLKLKNGVAIF